MPAALHSGWGYVCFDGLEQGFYTTPSFSFAKNTAINKAKKTNSYKQIYVEPYVLVFEYNERKAKEICNILNFTKLDIKWVQLTECVIIKEKERRCC